MKLCEKVQGAHAQPTGVRELSASDPRAVPFWPESVLRTRAIHLRTDWSDRTDLTNGKRPKYHKFLVLFYSSLIKRQSPVKNADWEHVIGGPAGQGETGDCIHIESEHFPYVDVMHRVTQRKLCKPSRVRSLRKARSQFLFHDVQTKVGFEILVSFPSRETMKITGKYHFSVLQCAQNMKKDLILKVRVLENPGHLTVGGLGREWVPLNSLQRRKVQRLVKFAPVFGFIQFTSIQQIVLLKLHCLNFFHLNFGSKLLLFCSLEIFQFQHLPQAYIRPLLSCASESRRQKYSIFMRLLFGVCSTQWSQAIT